MDRRQALVVVAAVVLAGCVGGAPAVEHPQGATPRTWSLLCPEPCPNLLDGGARAASEAHVAVNPTDPDHRVVAAVHHETPSPGPARWIYVHASFDGGASWETSRIPGGPTAGPTHPLAGASLTVDGAVAVLPDGAAVVAGLAAGDAFHGGMAIFTVRSPDGGRTWETPVVQPEPTDDIPLPYVVDKSMIAAGPEGDLLLTWHTAAQTEGSSVPQKVYASYSEDGGHSWSAPVKVAQGSVAYPAISEAGTWHVAYSTGSRTELATSRDHGATWAVKEIATSTSGHVFVMLAAGPAGGEGEVLAMAHVQRVDRKWVPTVWISLDDGRTWTPPIPVDEPELEDAPHWLHPAAVVDGRGVVHVSFHHARDDGTHEARATAVVPCPEEGEGCVEGWLALDPMRLGDLLTGPRATYDPYEYHYRSMAPLPEGAYGVWMVGGDPQDSPPGEPTSHLAAAAFAAR